MTSPTRDTNSGSVGLFGKVPAQPDFARYGSLGPAAQELDRWLVGAVERLHLSRSTLQGAVRLSYASPDARAMLVGVLAPSNDRLGRSFPCAIVHSRAQADVNCGQAAIPEAYAAFLDQAEGLLADLPGLAAPDIAARLSALSGPGPDELAAARARCAARIQANGAPEFLERAFGPLDQSMHWYGLHTLLTAALPLRSRSAPGRATPTLDLPVAGVNDGEVWLELIERLVPGPNLARSFLWTTSEPRRLLFRWGVASEEVLCALADTRYASSSLWPLRTERPAAVERARAALTGALTDLTFAPGTTLERLLAVLAQTQL